MLDSSEIESETDDELEDMEESNSEDDDNSKDPQKKKEAWKKEQKKRGWTLHPNDRPTYEIEFSWSYVFNGNHQSARSTYVLGHNILRYKYIS